MFTPVKWFT